MKLFNNKVGEVMLNPTKNIRGDIATPIMTILGIVTIVAFLVLTFDKLAPAVTYIKANQIVRKYSLIMENEGGLSSQNKLNMISELSQKNIKIDQSNISASESANYGEDLTLTLAFDYKSSELLVSGFEIKRTQKDIPMRISRSTVSRRYYRWEFYEIF